MGSTETPFQQIILPKELLSSFPGSWFVVGGWAIDLFLGFQSRDHKDLEIGVYRSNQIDLKSFLQSWKFVKVVQGVSESWTDGEFLSSPVHEIHAQSESEPQTELEILLQEETDMKWVYRRNASIRADKRSIVLSSAAGIPYLSPEIVLLYKAKQQRGKDEADFALVRDRLGGEQRLWLKAAIETCHPGHSWLAQLYSK